MNKKVVKNSFFNSNRKNNKFSVNKTQKKFNYFQFIKKLFLNNNNNNSKLDFIHNLIFIQRKNLIDNILLFPESIISQSIIQNKKISFIYEIFFHINDYINTFLLYIHISIKNLNKENDFYQANKNKIKVAFNVISNEIFNGILTYSLNVIINTIKEIYETNNKFNNNNNNEEKNIENKNIIYNHIKVNRKILLFLLKLISSLFKYSNKLNFNKFTFKFINLYKKIFELSLNDIKDYENKYSLLSYVNFNLANFYIKNNYFKNSIDLYKNVILYENEIKKFDYILIFSYFNLGIIHYVNGKLLESENYLNEAKERIFLFKYSFDNKFLFEILDYKIKIMLSIINLDNNNLIEAFNILKKIIYE